MNYSMMFVDVLFSV